MVDEDGRPLPPRPWEPPGPPPRRGIAWKRPMVFFGAVVVVAIIVAYALIASDGPFGVSP